MFLDSNFGCLEVELIVSLRCLTDYFFAVAQLDEGPICIGWP